jgi:hypothetical protein
MAGFEDCIRSARTGRQMSDEEADDLISRFREHQDALRASGVQDDRGGRKGGAGAGAERRARARSSSPRWPSRSATRSPAI